jgi:hypothetical protein
MANEYCDRFKDLNFREYCNRVICIEVEEPLEKFERDYPPASERHMRTLKRLRCRYGNINSEVSLSQRRSEERHCSSEITDEKTQVQTL